MRKTAASLWLAVSWVGIDLRRCLVKFRNAERENMRDAFMMEIEEQNTQQHQHRAGQCIQKEFDRRVKFARTAPDADQQVHRHQHGFPEDEEKEEIQRHEDAE